MNQPINYQPLKNFDVQGAQNALDQFINAYLTHYPNIATDPNVLYQALKDNLDHKRLGIALALFALVHPNILALDIPDVFSSVEKGAYGVIGFNVARIAPGQLTAKLTDTLQALLDKEAAREIAMAVAEGDPANFKMSVLESLRYHQNTMELMFDITDKQDIHAAWKRGNYQQAGTPIVDIEDIFVQAQTGAYIPSIP